jgi:hypothetical protein
MDASFVIRTWLGYLFSNTGISKPLPIFASFCRRLLRTGNCRPIVKAWSESCLFRQDRDLHERQFGLEWLCLWASPRVPTDAEREAVPKVDDLVARAHDDALVGVGVVLGVGFVDNVVGVAISTWMS